MIALRFLGSIESGNKQIGKSPPSVLSDCRNEISSRNSASSMATYLADIPALFWGVSDIFLSDMTKISETFLAL
jgi:hypothetical protein